MTSMKSTVVQYRKCVTAFILSKSNENLMLILIHNENQRLLENSATMHWKQQSFTLWKTEFPYILPKGSCWNQFSTVPRVQKPPLGIYEEHLDKIRNSSPCVCTTLPVNEGFNESQSFTAQTLVFYSVLEYTLLLCLTLCVVFQYSVMWLTAVLKLSAVSKDNLLMRMCSNDV